MSTVADGLPDILPDLRRWAHKLTAGHHDALDLVHWDLRLIVADAAGHTDGEMAAASGCISARSRPG